MQINSSRKFSAPVATKSAAQPAATAQKESKPAGDEVAIDWSGSRPAHRSVKKITALAVTAVDLGSGLAHHAGDNYLNPNLPHTQWHTQPTDADYCMVGFSNKALDSVEFWPKWEKLVYKTTGKEPISWKVPEYKAYCLGEIDAQTLHQKQVESGMIKS